MVLNKMDPVTGELIERHIEVAYEEAYEALQREFGRVTSMQWMADKPGVVQLTTIPEHYPPNSLCRRMIMAPNNCSTVAQIKEKMMSGTSKFMSPDDVVGSAIAKAIRHSERVAKREHIKADRVERVNQYLVSLRRELSYISSAHPFGPQLANSLLRKEIWYDLGQIHPSFPTYGVSFSKETLVKWMTIAQRLRKAEDAQTDEIMGDLEELERSLAGMTSLVEESGRIADEGEVVASQLCQVLS